MRVSRCIQANATGPDAHLVQRSVREVYCDRQRRRRERLNAQCLVSDRVPSSPPVLPLTGPVALSVQCSVREQNRDRQHCRPERLNAQGMDSERVHSSPPFCQP